LLEQGIIKYTYDYPHYICVKKIFDPTIEFYRLLAEDLAKLKKKGRK